LALSDTGATCPNQHSFDRGRGGYLNLLVGGRINSQAPRGDTPDALAARRRFLSGGFYEPIADTLAEMVGDPGGPLIDVGCGEGYYLSRLAVPNRHGLDVSKSAVQMAARLLPDSQFVVGSAYRLPVLDSAVAAVVSVFAPHPLDEFARVLRPGGRWVTVTPGAAHLDEMRPTMHGDAEAKAADRRRQRSVPPEGAATAKRLTFQLDLPAVAARDLYSMTPIRWQSGAGHAAGGDIGSVTVDVWISSSASP
jgi:23S rRNA (guanine745-N1)-methyltransferase